MPRRPRTATGGYVYHVLNRAVARATVFHKDGDYAAFERVLRQAKDKLPMRLLAYCIAAVVAERLAVWDGDLAARDGPMFETGKHTQAARTPAQSQVGIADQRFVV